MHGGGGGGGGAIAGMGGMRPPTAAARRRSGPATTTGAEGIGERHPRTRAGRTYRARANAVDAMARAGTEGFAPGSLSGRAACPPEVDLRPEHFPRAAPSGTFRHSSEPCRADSDGQLNPGVSPPGGTGAARGAKTPPPPPPAAAGPPPPRHPSARAPSARTSEQRTRARPPSPDPPDAQWGRRPVEPPRGCRTEPPPSQ